MQQYTPLHTRGHGSPPSQAPWALLCSHRTRAAAHAALCSSPASHVYEESLEWGSERTSGSDMMEAWQRTAHSTRSHRLSATRNASMCSIYKYDSYSFILIHIRGSHSHSFISHEGTERPLPTHLAGRLQLIMAQDYPLTL